MADLDIARLRELLAKATRGPWEDYGGNVVQRDDPYGEVIPDRCPAAWCGASVLSAPDDRALIVAAVNALPALLNEVEALRAAADPETLRFGPPDVNSERHAVSVDGSLYTVRPPEPDEPGEPWFWCLQDSSFSNRTEGTGTTAALAIEAARSHDRRRRGAK